MRKKICVRCNKIINDGDICCFEPKKISKKQEDSDKKLRTKRWKRTREAVLRRDNYLCQRCLIKYNILNSDNLTVHHIEARRDNDELFYNLDNLICLCRTCNLQVEIKELNHKLDFKPKDNKYDFNL